MLYVHICPKNVMSYLCNMCSGCITLLSFEAYDVFSDDFSLHGGWSKMETANKKAFFSLF